MVLTLVRVSISDQSAGGRDGTVVVPRECWNQNSGSCHAKYKRPGRFWYGKKLENH